MAGSAKFRMSASLAILASLSVPAYAQESDSAVSSATDCYFDVDLTCLEDLSGQEDRLAIALLDVARNVPSAPSRLELALGDDLSPTDRERLVDLIVREHIARYDYAAASLAADRLGAPDAVTPVERNYAKFPALEAEAGATIIELPYTKNRVPAVINGKAVELIFDTGAENIGVDGALVEELGLRTDTSASRQSRVPAYNLDFPVYAVLIDELKLGELTFRNVAGNFGDVPEEQREDADRLKRDTNGAQLIMGLDLLRTVADVVEFDWDKNVVRIIIEDETPARPANYVLNSGAAPVMKVRFGERVTNLSFDSGAYTSLIGPESTQAAKKRGTRTYKESWGEFSESLVEFDFVGTDPVALWASGRRFAESEHYNVTGVLGKLLDGIVRVDMEDRHLSIRDFDPREAKLGFEIVAEDIEFPAP